MFSENELRDAFLCGVVAGRLETANPKTDDTETVREKVEAEYGPYWSGELIWAGYNEDPDGPVNQLEAASWMAHHKTLIHITGDCLPTTLLVAGSLPIGKEVCNVVR